MDLMSMLPWDIYPKETHVADFQKAVQTPLEKLKADWDDLFLQLRVSTATWGLRSWEEAYGIDTDYRQSEESRRNRVIAKMRGQGTTTPEKLRRVVESFLGPDMSADVKELFEKYIVEITICGTQSRKDYRQDVLAAVREIMPAHLGLYFTTESKMGTDIYVGGGVRMGYMQTILPERKLTYDFRTDEKIKAAAANITYTVLPLMAT